MGLVRTIFKHELISGASFIFMGSLFANLLNFLFNVFMTRNLSVEGYGILASLTSLIMLAVLPAGAIIPVMVRFGALYFAKGELAMVRGLFLKIMQPMVLLSSIILIIFLLFQDAIGKFFNIEDNFLIVIASISIFMGYIGIIVNPALLQAKLAFAFIAFINTFSALLRLLFGIIAVFMGFSVGGVLLGALVAGVIPFILSFIPLRFLFKRGVGSPIISYKSLLTYGFPAALATFGLTSFTSTDIILVKHFFDPTQAGIYATLSLIGKVIFYFSAPITTVMFPLVTQKHAKEENFHGTFQFALFLVLVSSLSIAIFYFLFPEFTISFFSKKKESIAGAPYLAIFAVFITIYALLSILVNFYLSIKKTIVFVPIIIAAFLQVVLIWLYHETFLQVISISIAASGLLLFLLLLYYFYFSQKEKIAKSNVLRLYAEKNP